MGRRAIDLRTHRARPLDRELVAWADVILVMETFHREWVLRKFPEAASRTELLSVYAGMDGEVDDPYGGDEDAYLACANRLEELIDRLVPRLRS
jgi:protein-tyrosine-phosphatase